MDSWIYLNLEITQLYRLKTVETRLGIPVCAQTHAQFALIVVPVGTSGLLYLAVKT